MQADRGRHVAASVNRNPKNVAATTIARPVLIVSISETAPRENLDPVERKAMVLSHPVARNDQEKLDQLQQLDSAIEAVVLQRQNPLSGLLPA